jgi:hypothetical protein
MDTLYNKDVYFRLLLPRLSLAHCLTVVRLWDVSDELGTDMVGDGRGPLKALFWNFPGGTMENHVKCVSDRCWGLSSVTAVLWRRR